MRLSPFQTFLDEARTVCEFHQEFLMILDALEEFTYEHADNGNTLRQWRKRLEEQGFEYQRIKAFKRFLQLQADSFSICDQAAVQD